MKKTILILTVITTFSACATTFNYRSKTSDLMEIKKGEIQQVSKIAEYRVETTKVSGTYTGVYNAGRSVYYIELAKEIAIGNAIANGKCDFLIHPLYDVSVVGKQINCIVEGYPAFYTTFKTWTRTDSIPMGYVPVKTSNNLKNVNADKKNQPKKKGSTASAVVTAVLLGVLGSVLLAIAAG